MKQCSACGQLKPESEFSKDKTKADGLRSQCKECDKQYAKQYHLANREKKLERSKQYYAANHDKERKRHKRYREAHPEQYLWTGAKGRAKTRGLEFNIEVSDIVIPEFCPVLGLKLEKGKGEQQDSSPTLDRIDSSKGYIKGNIEVISWRANRLKNDATPEELRKVADYYER